MKIKDVKARLALFVHALAGAARRSNKIRGGGFACIAIISCPASTAETGLAGGFGGGLDVRIKKRLALRLFQIDYNPIKFKAGTEQNYRFSAGLVF